MTYNINAQKNDLTQMILQNVNLHFKNNPIHLHNIYFQPQLNQTIAPIVVSQLAPPPVPSKPIDSVVTVNPSSPTVQKISDQTFLKPSLTDKNLIPDIQNLWKDVMGEKSSKTGTQLLENIEFCRKQNKQIIKLDPTLYTTIHQLYEKTAERLLTEGKVEEAFHARSLAARKIKFIPSHPLFDIYQAIQKSSQKPLNYSTAGHISHLGAGIVKGGNIQATARNIDGKPTHSFDFKLSHPYRKKLETSIELIKNHHAKFIASLPETLKEAGVTISEISHSFKGSDEKGIYSDVNGYTPNNAKAWQIDFPGKGKVIVGKSQSYGCLFNNVSVQLDQNLPEGKGVETIHQMMSVLGCGPVVCEARTEDMERMKIAQLFRAYYPKEAFTIERSKDFYEMPIEELKAKIENAVPQMKAIFTKYLIEHPELLQEVEIYQGKKIWGISDLADQIRDKGAWGLMSGVGYGKTIEQASESIVSILSYGAISSEDRFKAGLFKHGASSEPDLMSGGGDQVFTRMITNNLSVKEINQFTFSGKVQILYDLDVVNRVSYGYNSDHFGAKNEYDTYGGGKAYKERSNLIDLAQNLTSFNTTNEVMVKNRIGPEYMRGLMVQSVQDKAVLIDKLKTAGLIQTVDGQDIINGKPVDQFIHVSSHFKKEMW